MYGAWLRGQLSRHTYRPGWRLTIVPADSFPVFNVWQSMWQLLVEFEAPDTYQPNQLIKLSVRLEVPMYLTEALDDELFSKWLQNRLFDIEMHESREWLRRDGRIYDDPHAVKRPELVPA